jgi:hypothetical protein
MEAGVVVGFEGEPLYWHLPSNRTVAFLPDSRALWDVFWENRERLKGFAHSHPGSGVPSPSWEDLTTFAAVEQGLGRRLVWWIISEDNLVIVLWAGPGPHDYRIYLDTDEDDSAYKGWLEELRKSSYKM